MARSAFQVILVLIVLGVILTFAAPYIPPPILTMIFAVIAVGLLLWLAQLAGLIGGPPAV